MIKSKQRIIFYMSMILCFFYMPFVYADSGQSLSTSPEWLALGHYRPTITGQYKSSIDSDSFFLAPDGKTNPESELNATMELFKKENTSNDKKCLFPARYIYLTKQNQALPPFPDCAEYEQFKSDLNPVGITFLYTDAYMNNPSSLFGHTLIRIDIPEGKTQLVAHGMNYGAYVDENTAGPLYAVYGLTGGYYGGFTVKPYYQIINTYNNMENRDIWEYELNLTSEELDFFVAHLWEMGHTQTRYYFFTKNCSYLLMEVLDAIRPDLKLAHDFPLQVIPLDTIKAINQRNGLIKNASYRPSRQKRIAYRYQQMTSDEKSALQTYLNTEKTESIEKLSENSQIAVWDAAYEFIQYQWVKQNIELDEYRRKSFQILRNRRNIATTSLEVEIPADNPIQAHDSMRISLAIGTERRRAFEEIGWRAAYHSLTEKTTGLLSGAEINFLDTTFRFIPQTKNIRLQQLDLVKITSLTPFNALFHPMSYQIHTGLNREWNPKTNREKLVYAFKGGSGVTFQPYNHLSAYSLLNTKVKYSGGLYRHPFGAAIGVSTGLLYTYKDIQTQLEMERNFSDQTMMKNTLITSEINYSFIQNYAISTTYQFKDNKHHSENIIKFSIKNYF